MNNFYISVSLILIYSAVTSSHSLKRDDCEVCFGVVDRFRESLTPEIKSDPKLIENEFRKFCKTTKSRENRFCYYLGGTEDAATGILNKLSQPLSNSYPTEIICERLWKSDSQICDIRYEKIIDIKTAVLKKLKVKDLKNILNEWDEVCEGCIEKSDFVNRIEELKPKYLKEEL